MLARVRYVLSPQRLKMAVPTQCVFPRVDTPWKRTLCAGTGFLAVSGVTGVVGYGLYNFDYDGACDRINKKVDDVNQWREKHQTQDQELCHPKEPEAEALWRQIWNRLYGVMEGPLEVMGSLILPPLAFVGENVLLPIGKAGLLIFPPIVTLGLGAGSLASVALQAYNTRIWFTEVCLKTECCDIIRHTAKFSGITMVIGAIAATLFVLSVMYAQMTIEIYHEAFGKRKPKAWWERE